MQGHLCIGDVQQDPLTGCCSPQYSGHLRQSPRAHLQWHQARMIRAARPHHFRGPGITLDCARGSTSSGASGTSQHNIVQLVCCNSSEEMRWFSSTACAGSAPESQTVPVSRGKKSSSNGPSAPAVCAPCDPSILTTSRVPKRSAHQRVMGGCKTTSGPCPALTTQ